MKDAKTLSHIFLWERSVCLDETVSFINIRHREAWLPLPCFWTFVHIKQFPSPWLLNFLVVKFISTVTWQENGGKKGWVGLDCIFPEHSEISGYMEHESSLSVGNFYDLYRVGQILPKLCFFTPQCMIVKGQILGRQKHIHIFSCNLLHIIVFFDILCFTWQYRWWKLRSSVMRDLPGLPCMTV